ncbi:MAG: MFS transporter [Gammaproteobacteria bacterium]|nr:MFS transporter [Gammaproteobacteria bacterium]
MNQRTVRRTLLAAAFGMFLDGFDLSIMAVALLSLREDWQLTPASTGALMAAALLGSLLGGAVGGWLVDRYGRRALLLPNILLYILGAVLSAAAADLALLWMGRFTVGLAVGMDYPLVATVIAEYSETEGRGNHFAHANIAWYVGALTSTLVGLLLLFWAGVGAWRFMLLAAAFPALGLLWLRRNIPESPRWLARKGRATDAQSALTRLHPAWSTERVGEATRGYGQSVRRWRVLFQAQWRRRLWLSIAPWFCLDVVSLGIGLYFPVVLRTEGFAATNVEAAAINAIFLVISIGGVAFAAPRLDRIGRIPLQIAGFLLMAFGLTVFIAGLLAQMPGFVYTGAAFFSIGTGIGPGVTAMALAVEIFPTELRASAGGLATAISRLGAALSAIVFPTMAAHLGLPAVLFSMTLVSLLGALISHWYAIEPAGKSLEELEPGHGFAENGRPR